MAINGRSHGIKFSLAGIIVTLDILCVTLCNFFL